MLKIDPNSNLPLRDCICSVVRNAILEGELQAGARLTEIQLATQLGVSRTPVREALHMLEKEGLTVITPRKGARVMSMSVKDLEDVLEIRRVLDMLAVKTACDNITEEQLREMSVEVDNFSKLIENSSSDARKIVACDERFHDVIYKAANNPHLTETVTSLKEQMYRFRYEYVKEKSVLRTLLNEHRQILDCLKRKDKSAVKRIMSEHLVNQYDTVKKQIISRG